MQAGVKTSLQALCLHELSKEPPFADNVNYANNFEDVCFPKIPTMRFFHAANSAMHVFKFYEVVCFLVLVWNIK